MKRLLFIAYLYPPIANSGTRRSIEFVNHLPDHGWTPVVLTVQDPEYYRDRCDEALMAEVRPGTTVLRAPLGSRVWAERVAQLFPRGWQPRISAAIEWRLRRWWSVPDPAAPWLGPAVERAVAEHARQPFDLIHATGSPWTDFLVARAVSKRTGVPYTIDYRDPWTPSGNAAWEYESWLQRLFRDRLQRQVAKDAAAVITVTQQWSKLIGGHIGRRDVHCVTNGFEPRDFDGLPPPPQDGLVRVAYTGVWRRGYGPDLLYEAVRRAKAILLPNLDRLMIQTAGYAPGPAKEYGIDDIVHEHGPVSHRKALELMSTADLLFLPVSSGDYANSSIPGKVFEYLGSHRPILAAVPPNSEVARILSEVGASQRVDPDDVDATVTLLETLLTGQGEAHFKRTAESTLMEYSRAHTAACLAGVLNSVPRSS